MYAQDEYDDIYYNPKSDKTSRNNSKKKQSNYIANFSEIDVDDYNRRGFYYETEIDTIGVTAEHAEDFVYTQQIQKYYNPTIVVDNADVLEDLLENSYGNVEIVIENGSPVFTSIYTGGYAWAPVYYNWNWRPSWSWSYAWGPYSIYWNWGPSWTWGPGWGWDYPIWGYHPWHPVPRPPHHPHYAYGRPGAGRPVAPNPGWSHNTRPGGNYAGSMARPGSRGDGTHGMTATTRRTYGRNSQAVTGLQSSEKKANRVVDRSVGKTSVSQVRTVDGSGSRTGRTDHLNTTSVSGANREQRGYKTTNRTMTNRSVSEGTVTQRSQSGRNYNTTNRTTTTNSSNRSYNTTNRSTGSSSRSYGTSRSSSSRGSGSYRMGGGSRGGGGSHGGGRGGRR